MARYTITFEIDENGMTVVPNPPSGVAPLSSTQGVSGSDLASRLLSRSYEQTVAAKGGGGIGDTGPGTGGIGDTGPGSGGIGDTGPGSGGIGDTGPGTARVRGVGKGAGGIGDTGPGTGGTSYSGISGQPGFPLQPQQQVEWCWAAIAVAVDKYFNPASTLRQCDVANSVVGRNDCCGKTGGTAECNVAEQLQDALASIGHLRAVLPRPFTFEEIRTEIDAGRPACARIAWESGGAHFVAIDGYRLLSTGAQHIYVADPLNPPSEVDFDEFTSAYHGEGTWTGTYLVRG